MSFGSDLREERERRGIGLAEIAAATRFSERHLRALEAGAHAELPGGIINKGIVRGYCRHIGLEEDAWAKRFSDEFEAATPAVDWSEFADNVQRSGARHAPTGRRWWGVLLMVAALAGLLFCAWHFVLKRRLISRPSHAEGASTEPFAARG